ncbi:lipopolysaccharide biosynthesis protein [Herbiconiux sp. SYSU D00978]|uniref:lipopolysaccharide biosynthesis protein n=1 Tax=Herbiconiux sp. SYSU D00978 TaxID=2812562 RepID=UPI001A97A686|nr:hypothetical protein [Herbiconiux sp. SYSU D00978]
MVGEGSRRAPYVTALAATVVSGLLTYVFLALVSRSLTAAAFDDFSVFWSLSLLVGFGLFVPLEQELARDRRGGDQARGVHETLAVGLLLSGVAVIVLTVLAGSGVVQLPPAILWIAIGLALLSPLQYTAKGHLVQQDRIVLHSVTTVVENVVRTGIAAVAFLMALSSGRGDDAGLASLAVAIALVTAYVWVLLPALRRPRLSLRGTVSRVRVVLAILVPSLAGQVLLNSGPLVIDALVDAAGSTGAFQATFNLARLPLLVVLPLQAVLIGRMAPLVRAGRVQELTTALSQFAVAVLGVALLGAALGWLVGPFFVELLFGPGRSLPPAGVALLIAAVCIYVGLVINTQALIVNGRTRSAAYAWLASLAAAAVGFGLGFALEVPLAVALGLLTGALVAWVVSILQLRWRTAHSAS